MLRESTLVPAIRARYGARPWPKTRRARTDDVLRRLAREAKAGDLNEPSMARVRALELLGMHLGMFPDRAEYAIVVSRSGWIEAQRLFSH